MVLECSVGEHFEKSIVKDTHCRVIPASDFRTGQLLFINIFIFTQASF